MAAALSVLDCPNCGFFSVAKTHIYSVSPISAEGLKWMPKYAVLFAATILAARKLNEIRSKPCPAQEGAISDASNAELILKLLTNAGLRRRTARVAELRCEAAVLVTLSGRRISVFLSDCWPARGHG